MKGFELSLLIAVLGSVKKLLLLVESNIINVSTFIFVLMYQECQLLSQTVKVLSEYHSDSLKIKKLCLEIQTLLPSEVYEEYLSNCDQKVWNYNQDLISDSSRSLQTLWTSYGTNLIGLLFPLDWWLCLRFLESLQFNIMSLNNR